MFDPAQPSEGSPLQSAVMRSQLTSLKALIDAILTLTAAQVDGVTTLNPGEPAEAAVTVDGNTLHFTFGIPRGADGAEGVPGSSGNPGSDGPQGPPGPDGAQGPPFANAEVDGVTTLDPDQSATVSVTFNGTNVIFTFGIPRGADGAQGADGQPGEVSTAQLDSAIATTALNPDAVSPLSQSADGSYNQGQMQQVMDKLDELLNAVKRA